MTTRVLWNGSKWAGEEPDSIDVLCERLRTATLMPSLAPFSCTRADGAIHFFGNFVDVSHSFGIDTTDAEVIARLSSLIRENVETVAYKEAEQDQRDRDARKAERIARGGSPFREAEHPATRTPAVTS